MARTYPFGLRNYPPIDATIFVGSGRSSKVSTDVRDLAQAEGRTC
jgi:hypothetical protein